MPNLPNQDDRTPVVVKTYAKLWQAELDRGRLKAEGLAALVLDATVTGMLSDQSWSIGNEIRLTVAQEDVPRALAILDTPEDQNLEGIINQENITIEDPTKQKMHDQPRCPACGSDLIKWAEHSGTTVFRSLLLLGLPLLFIHKQRKCQSCNHKWKPL